MHTFDHDFAKQVLARLERLDADAKPKWGRMTPRQMMGHLAQTLRYSMGEMGSLPDRSTWLSRRIIAPILLNGWARFPKNVQLPGRKRGASTLPESTAAELGALTKEYLERVQTGDVEPPSHPFFGPLDVDAWAKFHQRHFEHHLRQFGV